MPAKIDAILRFHDKTKQPKYRLAQKLCAFFECFLDMVRKLYVKRDRPAVKLFQQL